MFEIGTLVTGINGNGYIITNSNALCIVTNNINDYNIRVKLIATTNPENFGSFGHHYIVGHEYLKEISVREYIESHPSAKFMNDDDIDTLTEENITESISEIIN